jgi:hypothetical protein
MAVAGTAAAAVENFSIWCNVNLYSLSLLQTLPINMSVGNDYYGGLC